VLARENGLLKITVGEQILERGGFERKERSGIRGGRCAGAVAVEKRDHERGRRKKDLQQKKRLKTDGN